MKVLQLFKKKEKERKPRELPDALRLGASDLHVLEKRGTQTVLESHHYAAEDAAQDPSRPQVSLPRIPGRAPQQAPPPNYPRGELVRHRAEPGQDVRSSFVSWHVVGHACPPDVLRQAWSVHQFSPLTTLGKGAKSRVWQAKDHVSGRTVVFKVYDLRRMQAGEIDQLEREAEVHAKLSHPNVLQLWAAFQDQVACYFLLERAGDDLYKRYPTLPAKDESYLFMAPEVLSCGRLPDGSTLRREDREPYDAAADVWSVGCIVFELFARHTPFVRSTKEATTAALEACDYTMPRWASREAQDFIRRTLALDPRARPSIAELLDHRWVVMHAGRSAQGAEAASENVRRSLRVDASANAFIGQEPTPGSEKHISFAGSASSTVLGDPPVARPSQAPEPQASPVRPGSARGKARAQQALNTLVESEETLASADSLKDLFPKNVKASLLLSAVARAGRKNSGEYFRKVSPPRANLDSVDEHAPSAHGAQGARDAQEEEIGDLARRAASMSVGWLSRQNRQWNARPAAAAAAVPAEAEAEEGECVLGGGESVLGDGVGPVRDTLTRAALAARGSRGAGSPGKRRSTDASGMIWMGKTPRCSTEDLNTPLARILARNRAPSVTAKCAQVLRDAPPARFRVISYGLQQASETSQHSAD
ncbi:unnamed protein product [Pedinophyceae sp. YPF-701]|nr:unnamed protein product [Pedinophyceae sp. YPF-701]